MNGKDDVVQLNWIDTCWMPSEILILEESNIFIVKLFKQQLEDES